MKAKTYLQDEYLHDIKAAYNQRYFYYRAKCFHSFKTNESPHQLKLALCIVSGEVEYAYCEIWVLQSHFGIDAKGMQVQFIQLQESH